MTVVLSRKALSPPVEKQPQTAASFQQSFQQSFSAGSPQRASEALCRPLSQPIAAVTGAAVDACRRPAGKGAPNRCTRPVGIGRRPRLGGSGGGCELASICRRGPFPAAVCRVRFFLGRASARLPPAGRQASAASGLDKPSVARSEGEARSTCPMAPWTRRCVRGSISRGSEARDPADARVPWHSGVAGTEGRAGRVRSVSDEPGAPRGRRDRRRTRGAAPGTAGPAPAGGSSAGSGSSAAANDTDGGEQSWRRSRGQGSTHGR